MGGAGGGQPPAASTLSITSNGKLLSIVVDLHLGEQADKEIFTEMHRGIGIGAIWMKNQSLMAHHRSHRSELGLALTKYVNENKAFPRGTADRPTVRGQGLPWQPNQRLAWTADLMRYFGPPFDSIQADRNLSWNQGQNLSIASIAVPQLLAPDDPPGSYPSGTWSSPMHGTQAPVTATHFVGISGIGLESPDLDPADPAAKKKLGVFGYDRVTKVEDITDGLDRTIALIQVPAKYKTCWLAGGGATIRYVAESDPLSAFVCTRYKSKDGTFAIMCDGKVRFIAADMNPDTFKALCTIAGGEPIADIEAIAPEVKDEVVLKPVIPGETPKPGGDDLATLKGTWKLIQGIKDGREASDEDKKTEMTFDGTKLSIKDATGTISATFALDPTKNPKWFDLTINDVKRPGIYDLAADTLHICVAMKGDRPTAFEAPDGSGRSYTKLKKVSGGAPVDPVKPPDQFKGPVVKAAELTKEWATDYDAAKKKYDLKTTVLRVTGIVKGVTIDEKGTASVDLTGFDGETEVCCRMFNPSDNDKITKTVKKGQTITVQGTIWSGGKQVFVADCQFLNAESTPGDPVKPPDEQPKGLTYERRAHKEGRFTILMPTGEPFDTMHDITTPAGEVALFISQSIDKTGKPVGHAVWYSDTPEKALAGGAEAFLDSHVKYMETKGWKIQKAEKLKVLGHPARDLIGERNDIPGKVRLVLADKRLYQIVLPRDPKIISEDRIQRILDSFKIDGDGQKDQPKPDDKKSGAGNGERPRVAFADVQPILQKQCMGCHGGGPRMKGGLDVRTVDSLSRGGEHGPAFVPGDLGKSLLWKHVSENKMPPRRPLTQADKQTLQDWIVSASDATGTR
jgi:uncharacterized protein (TIGR03067 family)